MITTVTNITGEGLKQLFQNRFNSAANTKSRIDKETAAAAEVETHTAATGKVLSSVLAGTQSNECTRPMKTQALDSSPREMSASKE